MKAYAALQNGKNDVFLFHDTKIITAGFRSAVKLFK